MLWSGALLDDACFGIRYFLDSMLLRSGPASLSTADACDAFNWARVIKNGPPSSSEIPIRSRPLFPAILWPPPIQPDGSRFCPIGMPYNDRLKVSLIVKFNLTMGILYRGLRFDESQKRFLGGRGCILIRKVIPPSPGHRAWCGESPRQGLTPLFSTVYGHRALSLWLIMPVTDKMCRGPTFMRTLFCKSSSASPRMDNVQRFNDLILVMLYRTFCISIGKF